MKAKPRRAGSRRSGDSQTASVPATDETAEQRQHRLREAFLKLAPAEQAKLLDRATLRDSEHVLAGTVLEQARGRFFNPVNQDGHRVGTSTAIAHVADTLARAGARDPIEEMLLTQMVWAHSRVAYLTTLANKQVGVKQIQTISEAIERAHNTCRRLALALADYRRPPRQFIAAHQFNQAGQQVVQNNNAPAAPAPEPASSERKTAENGANEKGLPAPEAIPALGGGVGRATVEHGADEALAVNPGAGDSGRQGPIEPQRVEARRAER